MIDVGDVESPDVKTALCMAKRLPATENALLQMPFKAVLLFRPAYIQPLHGNSHKDKMVWGGLRFDETPLFVVEDACPELRDND